MTKVLAFTLLFLYGLFPLQGASASRQEYIIQFEANTRIEEIEAMLGNSFDSSRCIAPSFCFYLGYSKSLSEKELAQIRAKKEVKCLFEDFSVFSRSSVKTPNDPDINKQWYLRNINAFEAWDITTGGASTNGKTPVIAIFEEGFQIDHIDIDPNVFEINRLEVPDDGVDNDDNGYIDDYIGYNVSSGGDDHFFENKSSANDHGNGVLGVIAAKTNNNILLTGLNWDVKILPVSNHARSTRLSTWITGIDYIYSRRKLYNETNGKEGSFVVAYNMSFGSNTLNLSTPGATEFCAIFDSLGKVGILTVAATENNQTYNVDGTGPLGGGDLPSNCISPHLIVVTNMNQVGELEGAYGQSSVDIAAPATNIATLAEEEVNNSTTGTSFAAPQVAACVSLVYSILSPEVLRLSMSDPQTINLMIRDIILDNVSPIASMRGKTTSEGLLNLASVLRNTQLLTSTPQITDINSSEYQVFRHHDAIIISRSRRSKLIYQLISSSGIVFSSHTSLEEHITLPTDGLAPGIYFLRLVDCQNASAATRKIPIY